MSYLDFALGFVAGALASAGLVLFWIGRLSRAAKRDPAPQSSPSDETLSRSAEVWRPNPRKPSDPPKDWGA